MIREIRREEIPECVGLIRKSFATVADMLGFTQENAPRFTAFATTEERLYKQFDVDHRPMFGYCDGGEIVGYNSFFNARRKYLRT